jgi:hypothetical protein
MISARAAKAAEAFYGLYESSSGGPRFEEVDIEIDAVNDCIKTIKEEANRDLKDSQTNFFQQLKSWTELENPRQ